MACLASSPPGTFGSSSSQSGSAARSRKATTSGSGRMRSATSMSAKPIRAVTLCSTDCASVSAAPFSPSHA